MKLHIVSNYNRYKNHISHVLLNQFIIDQEKFISLFFKVTIVLCLIPIQFQLIKGEPV